MNNKGLTRTLGRASANLLVELSEQNKHIFSISDAQDILGSNYNATVQLLRRLEAKGWLVKLVPGKYLIIPLSAGREAVPQVNRYVIARNLVAPDDYYVSYYSAMDIHNMVTQPVTTVYVTVIRRRPNRVVCGVKYRFVSTDADKFWGWEEHWVTPYEQVRVSNLERTIVDCLANPKLCAGISELAKGLWMRKDEVDYERLRAYVERLRNRTVAKRMGFLLELYDIAPDGLIPFLQDFINESYARLDTLLPDKGRYYDRWKLRLNLEPEELKRIIWT